MEKFIESYSNGCILNSNVYYGKADYIKKIVFGFFYILQGNKIMELWIRRKIKIFLNTV